MKVRFVAPDGSVREREATLGERLLDVAQRDGQPLEGTCEGDMACATCHVIVDPADFARLPAASEDEEDMLDLAYGATRTSRLACQIVLDESLGGLTVRVPDGSRNMQGR
ncbi:2Fe-2S iron-sulfur cluster-binding protein [Sphingomonas sp. SUN019]|uniref:2Fe-2S iron-sulfur cluster-binding protein n=1 Tax=Sphingomonas sp. SUN019 TaxID=2937788 RepID=UPI002164D6C5|nr:2Fe-2S iron-sulfur cluster-binding protein [Sphingomonas sp. SUN019]UVO52201.1 2Fe-2S iron-sulfur cluster-binding protein [Sphingomonas sp. SUN019]